MPEPVADPTPTPTPAAPPAPSPAPAAPTVDPAPAAPPADDPVALAKRVGELEVQNKELNEYKQKADPVLETLYSDSGLLQSAIKIHNKRMGITTNEPPADPNAPADPNNPNPAPVAPSYDPDNRAATINLTMDKFESEVGISKLDPEKKQEIRGQIGNMLKEMLDPKGNKNINQVLDEVSLTKLPWYLKQSFTLISRDADVASAIERGKVEAKGEQDAGTGSIGSLASGDLPIDQIGLTGKEKEVAAKMGVSEEDYLKNKKEIVASRR